VKYKSIWGEPPKQFFWEASLTGDLVCGGCERTRPPHHEPGMLTCPSCQRGVDLKEEVIKLAKSRERAAFPNGRPSEPQQKWKGDDPYGS
jgi:uncharacterized Zn finger protein (UPF0148 family)